MPVFRIDYMEGGGPCIHTRIEIRRHGVEAQCFRDAVAKCWPDLEDRWIFLPNVPNGMSATTRAFKYPNEVDYYLVVKIED